MPTEVAYNWPRPDCVLCGRTLSAWEMIGLHLQDDGPMCGDCWVNTAPRTVGASKE